MTIKPLITLYTAKGIGIIILHPSGVIYSNQAGGYSCRQPEAEGVYVPLSYNGIEQEQMLYDYFTGPKWGGMCSDAIDNDDADAIDHILKPAFDTNIIKVDRTQLLNSYEAWVHVNIATQPEERPLTYMEGVGTTASGKTILDSDYERGVLYYPFYGFGECSGILTWSNSD